LGVPPVERPFPPRSAYKSLRVAKLAESGANHNHGGLGNDEF
jgi:hypothetical protein